MLDRIDKACAMLSARNNTQAITTQRNVSNHAATYAAGASRDELGIEGP